jgi:hypothetical protein
MNQKLSELSKFCTFQIGIPPTLFHHSGSTKGGSRLSPAQSRAGENKRPVVVLPLSSDRRKRVAKRG